MSRRSFSNYDIAASTNGRNSIRVEKLTIPEIITIFYNNLIHQFKIQRYSLDLHIIKTGRRFQPTFYHIRQIETWIFPPYQIFEFDDYWYRLQ